MSESDNVSAENKAEKIITSREQELGRIALREVDPRYVREFDPIVKGPVYAVIRLGLLGVATVFHIASKKLFNSGK